MVIWLSEALFKINIFIRCKWQLHWIKNIQMCALSDNILKKLFLVTTHHMVIRLCGVLFRINIFIPCKWQLCWIKNDREIGFQSYWFQNWQTPCIIFNNSHMPSKITLKFVDWLDNAHIYSFFLQECFPYSEGFYL